MLEAVLFIGAFLGVALMGAGVLAALTGRRKWRGYARPDEIASPFQTKEGAAFSPLQMDPFTLKWPSQTSDYGANALPELPWPSQTWDDNYFGRAAGDVQRIQETAERLDKQRDDAVRANIAAHERALAEAQDRRHAEDEERDRQAWERTRRAEEAQQQAREDAARSELDIAGLDQRGGPEQTSPQRQQQSRGGQAEATFFGDQGMSSSAPPPDEIARMVQEHGLSGAVEQIRSRTGWDFRTAAQHLAQVLRDHG